MEDRNSSCRPGASDRDLESQILVRELNHRVYNQFQLLAGLMAKCEKADAQSSRQRITDLEQRIFAFAAVNRLLARPDSTLSLHEHCRKCCESLLKAYGRHDVTLELHVDDLVLNDREMTYLSLALAELVVNALKYSLAGEAAGALAVKLSADHGVATLTVSNSRSGAPCDPLVTPRTVHSLACCLHGEVDVIGGADYAVRVRFPLASAAQSRGPLVHATIRSSISGMRA